MTDLEGTLEEDDAANDTPESDAEIRASLAQTLIGILFDGFGNDEAAALFLSVTVDEYCPEIDDDVTRFLAERG